MIGAVHREFLAVGKAYGLDLPEYDEATIHGPGTVESANFVGRGPESYAEMRGPSGLRHRYLLENVPFGFLPVSEFGRAAGVPTPVLDGLIALGGALIGEDMRSSGRTLERLGLEGLSKTQILDYVIEGSI